MDKVISGDAGFGVTPVGQNWRAAADTFDPAVFVTCLKERHSGVTATIEALIPVQSQRHAIAYVGTPLAVVDNAARERPESLRVLTVREAIRRSAHPLPDGRRRIWHVRRNQEMLLGVFVRDVLRRPIRLVFTSAALREHSPFPRWLISRMDAVIATTPGAAACVPKVAGIVGHGVDLDRFQPAASRDEAWAASGLPGKRGIGIFGRIREEKGTHHFVSAMLPLLARDPDLTAVVGGLCVASDQPFLDALHAKIEAAGLTERFVWTGSIPAEQMPAWYRMMSAVVCAPLYEGYGLTAPEAMASGVPVVATRTGAFPAMIDEGVNGFLVPLADPGAITAALDRLIADPARVEATGQRARERACERFSIAREADGIDEVYRELWRR